MIIRCLLLFCVVLAPGVLLAQQSTSNDSLVAINLETLNTSTNETFPFIPYGGTSLYFTRHNQEDGTDKVWSANRSDNKIWGQPNLLPATEGFGTIGSLVNDSAGEIFFASNINNVGSNMDIFSLVDGRPLNLDSPLNTKKWESQPSVTSDGRLLYFASNRGAPKSSVKIYVSHRSSNGKWMEPVTLGSKINSGPYTGSPFITRDGKTLLFVSGGSSAGIYISKKNGMTDTDWSEPILLPYPINDHYTSLSPCLSPDEKEMYFASDRPEGKGMLDIYMVRLPHGLESLYSKSTK